MMVNRECLQILSSYTKCINQHIQHYQIWLNPVCLHKLKHFNCLLPQSLSIQMNPQSDNPGNYKQHLLQVEIVIVRRYICPCSSEIF